MAGIQISEERGVRHLHFGSPWIQGAMRIARPWALELEYTRQMMAPLLLRDDDWPRSVLQVGLGAGSVTKFLHRHRPGARITVVEISPPVVIAARQYFHLPEESDHLRIEIAEGHEYLAGTRRKFDLILVDAFDEKGRPGMIDSAPFYANCRDRLARGGLAAFNLLTRTRGAAPALGRLKEAFGEEMAVLPITEAGNLVVIAGIEPPLPDLREAADAMRKKTGLDLRRTLSPALSQGRGSARTGGA